MRTFTETDIRVAMAAHHPGNEGDCICAWSVPSVNIYQEFTVDHLIDVLKAQPRQEVPAYLPDSEGKMLPMEYRRPW